MDLRCFILIILVSRCYSTTTCQNNDSGITICLVRGTHVNKTASKGICSSTPGHLFENFNQDLTNFAKDRLFMSMDVSSIYWIGLSRVGPDDYRWDTSQRTTEGYDNWASPGTHNCVAMRGSDAKWVSQPCSLQIGYICRKYEARETTTSRDISSTTDKSMTSQWHSNRHITAEVPSMNTTGAYSNILTSPAETIAEGSMVTFRDSLTTHGNDTMNLMTRETDGEDVTMTASSFTLRRETSTSKLDLAVDECNDPCVATLSLEEKLSNATIDEVQSIIVSRNFSAEEMLTVQEWYQQKPEYTATNEDDLYRYTTEYIQIFDDIIAFSNEETFELANPAVFAEACNVMLENYAHKSSINSTILSFENIECEVVQISTESFEGFTTNFNQDETELTDFVIIENDWLQDYSNNTENSTMEIISVLYQTSSVWDFRTKHANEIVSSLVSITVLLDGMATSVPVVFGLVLNEEKIKDVTKATDKTRSEQFCVFWDTSSDDFGFWNTFGCTRTNLNESFVQCYCNHTTNFAILMKTTEIVITDEHQTALSLLSLIGLGISTVALLLTILILLCLPSLKSDRVFIHKHLVIALIIAQSLFISTTAAVRHQFLCKLVAILLHYFYLAVFVWMLIEGLHLYLEIVQVFSRFDGKNKTFHYIVGGWGLPFIIVAASVAIRWNSYGEGEGCWLSVHDGLIWAFLGPVVFVILINFIILLLVVRVVYRASSARGKDETEYKHLTAALKGALFLLPLLGLSWAIGFMSVNEGTLVFQYLFVVFNSLQGLFIFLFYCALNKEVRGALSRRFSRVTLESGDSRSISLRAVAKLKTAGKSTSPVLRFNDDTSGVPSKSPDRPRSNVTPSEPVSASGISVHNRKSEFRHTVTSVDDNNSPFSPDYN